MTENEMNQRRAGFMTAIGLLAKNADPAVREGILETLKSLGDTLHSEIESDDHLEGEEGTNPCPPGYYWNSELQACVPIIITDPQ